MSDFPAIPDPSNTPESMLETILALKQAVEMLTGQRGLDSTTVFTATDGASLSEALIAAKAAAAALAAEKIPYSILTTRGDIIRRNADIAERYALGTTGQFLRAGANDPTWETPTVTETWSWFIEFPEDKDYKVIVKLPYAATINSITTISTTGTCTLTGKINTTALGGTANSVSTSESEQTHSSANVAVVGDDIVLTISANSGCENMTVTMKVTRTI